jgi:hypothetical protein
MPESTQHHAGNNIFGMTTEADDYLQCLTPFNIKSDAAVRSSARDLADIQH